MSILDDIVAHKRASLAQKKSNAMRWEKLFGDRTNPWIIAEIKLASPSFDLTESVDYDALVHYYCTDERIRGISILIDEAYFAGDIRRIDDIVDSSKPVLFKEFVIDSRQIDGASYYGYDGILLLARVLSDDELEALASYALEKNIMPFIEVDNRGDLERILWLDALSRCVLWVNCRDLWTMEIDPAKHFSLIAWYEQQLEERVIFALSGVASFDDLPRYEGVYNGVLIWTSFVKHFA